MATNADDQVQEETIVNSGAEDELRKAKEELGTNPNPEESALSEEESTKDEESLESEEESPDESDETLTTTPVESEKDLDWYKKAYEESTKEALRLKALAEEKVSPPVIETAPVETDGVTLTPEQLYIKQKQDEEIADAFADITKTYPQVSDPEEYKKFTAMANTFGRTILDAEKRLATPKELYAKTVIALGWTSDDSQEKLGAALKDGAGSPRVSSGGPKSTPTSKVTDAMIIANRKMYPGKSDTEIREELEPYVQ